MGCGSSAVVAPDGEIKANGISESKPTNNNQKVSPNHAQQNGHQNGHVKRSSTTDIFAAQKNPQSMDKNGNKMKSIAPQAPVPKSVAFDVTLDGEIGDGLLRVPKRPPRLQTLEPLNLPKLTAEQLAEKQRIADEKRQKLKEKKINTSQKSSKRRKELLKAREFGMKQQMEQEKSEIDDSLRQAEIRKEQRLLEIKEKQRIREERAKRARERAKRIQNPEDEVVEVEKDTEFNAASDESWLSNPQNTDHNDKDHHDNDDEEPQKKLKQLRPTASASTVDSYDAAFMRNGTQERIHVQSLHTNNDTGLNDDDDFFGS